jgi:hypothetical protein
MRRRAAIEPVIGHLKGDNRIGRNYLKGRDGVLAAVGYNFSLLLRWFDELLRALSLILCHALLAAPLPLTGCRKNFLHGRFGLGSTGAGCSARRPLGERILFCQRRISSGDWPVRGPSGLESRSMRLLMVVFALVCARWFFVDLAHRATPFWRNLYCGRGTIQRCDRIRDDFISLGSAGVPDQSQEAKRCCILRLKSQTRQVKGN